MNETAFNELAGWVTEAGLVGRTESELMSGFCRRIANAGVRLARAIVILDTLHPIYEGRAFRWRADTPEAVEILDYGRTNEGEAAENWHRSPFFHLLPDGAAFRFRPTAADEKRDCAASFPLLRLRWSAHNQGPRPPQGHRRATERRGPRKSDARCPE